MDPAREQLRADLLALGFDQVRFASLKDPPTSGLDAWFDQGYHADMAWMERSKEKREDPTQVLSGAESAILLGVSYWNGRPSLESEARWARYSTYDDYHDTMKPALVAAGRRIEERFGLSSADYRYYVDTGPVLERGWSARAGLGFIGKNAMLISRHHGNWLFLAAILVRKSFEADPPIRPRPPSGTDIGILCGKCTRCLDACPTRAFPKPGVVDARRCVSYQTIENKGVIPRELRPLIGDRIYGCDTCLEVCPWNRFAHVGRQMLVQARGEIAALPLGELLALTPESFARIFKGTPIKRVKLRGLLRNACIVAGNSGDPRWIGPLLTLARGEDLLVRIHALWALRALNAGDRLKEFANAPEPEIQEELAAPQPNAAEGLG